MFSFFLSFLAPLLLHLIVSTLIFFILIKLIFKKEFNFGSVLTILAIVILGGILSSFLQTRYAYIDLLIYLALVGFAFFKKFKLQIWQVIIIIFIEGFVVFAIGAKSIDIITYMMKLGQKTPPPQTTTNFLQPTSTTEMVPEKNQIDVTTTQPTNNAPTAPEKSNEIQIEPGNPGMTEVQAILHARSQGVELEFDESGLATPAEINVWRNPDQDYDNDGLSNFDEIAKYKTNPMKADTDDDGFDDGQEIRTNHDPLKK